jgi:hypothetical protein
MRLVHLHRDAVWLISHIFTPPRLPRTPSGSFHTPSCCLDRLGCASQAFRLSGLSYVLNTFTPSGLSHMRFTLSLPPGLSRTPSRRLDHLERPSQAFTPSGPSQLRFAHLHTVLNVSEASCTPSRHLGCICTFGTCTGRGIVLYCSQSVVSSGHSLHSPYLYCTSLSLILYMCQRLMIK